MKIVYFNTWNAKQQGDFIEYMKKEVENTDVFCLQEALNIARPALADTLLDFEEVHAEKQSESGAMYGVSIYTRKGIIVHESKAFFVENPKMGVAIHIEAEKNGKRIDICNMHGITFANDKKIDTPERLAQTNELLCFYAERENPKVIGGDYNILPATESIRLYAKNGFRDLINDYKIETTRNRLCWDSHDGRKLYFSDYVFTSPELNITSFAVINNEASDHLPMVLEIEF